MKADVLRAGRGLLSTSVARDPTAGKGLQLDDLGRVPSSVLHGGAAATTLPPSPSEGQQSILTDSLTTPTYVWLLQWSAKAAKWLFVGGSSGFAEVVTSETTTSATYAALATGGPSFALPRAGDYTVEIGAYASAVDSAGSTIMSYDIGGTGAVDADGVTFTGTAGTNHDRMNGSRPRLKTGLTAVTLTAKYKRIAGAGTCEFSNRWMRVTPVSLT